jgi:hypothetical protein
MFGIESLMAIEVLILSLEIEIFVDSLQAQVPTLLFPRQEQVISETA